jgi:hypothetical protein
LLFPGARRGVAGVIPADGVDGVERSRCGAPTVETV